MDCWSTLGIAPTSDQRCIKRAYLTQLKRNRPEDDAQAFQNVREAYEVALEHSTRPWLWPETEGEGSVVWFDRGVPRFDADSKAERALVDDDLPAWLRLSTVTDQNLAADVTAAPVPPNLTDALADPALALHDESKRVLYDNARQAAVNIFDPTHLTVQDQDVTALLRGLWRQREWQEPVAEQALERALFDSLVEFLVDSPKESDLVDQLAPGLAEVAAYYGWFTRKERRHDLPDTQINSLRNVVVGASVTQVWLLASQGQIDAAQKVLNEQLNGCVFVHLDMRRALEQHWAGTLIAAVTWPHALVETLFSEFNWAREAGACPPELFERHRRLWERDLLARIAHGGMAHDYVDVLAAKALLAPRIGWKVWDKSVNPEWHARMNRALIWLNGNAPDALQVVHPKVLRWWTSPRPQSTDMWNLFALITWIYISTVAASIMKPLNLSGWVWLFVMPLVIVLSAILGLNLVRGLAWLRLQWDVRLYVPWCRWDRKLAARIPLFQHWRWAQARNIGPTRDLLPISVLYCFEFFQYQSQESNSPLWHGMLLALIGSLVFGVLWYFGLRIFGDSQGTRNWMELKRAGVVVSAAD